MTGFINAVTLLITLGQLSAFTGYSAPGGNKIAQSLNLITNLNEDNLQTLLVGLATIFLILTHEMTRLRALGLVAAMIGAWLLVSLFGWDSVTTLNDIAEVPGMLLRSVLLVPAFSLAFVGLMQGDSNTKSYLNLNGSFPDASGD